MAYSITKEGIEMQRRSRTVVVGALDGLLTVPHFVWTIATGAAI